MIVSSTGKKKKVNIILQFWGRELLNDKFDRGEFCYCSQDCHCFLLFKNICCEGGVPEQGLRVCFCLYLLSGDQTAPLEKSLISWG